MPYKLEYGPFAGTAFIIKLGGSLYVVTCWHVVEKSYGTYDVIKLSTVLIPLEKASVAVDHEKDIFIMKIPQKSENDLKIDHDFDRCPLVPILSDGDFVVLKCFGDMKGKMVDSALNNLDVYKEITSRIQDSCENVKRIDRGVQSISIGPIDCSHGSSGSPTYLSNNQHPQTQINTQYLLGMLFEGSIYPSDASKHKAFPENKQYPKKSQDDEYLVLLVNITNILELIMNFIPNWCNISLMKESSFSITTPTQPSNETDETCSDASGIYVHYRGKYIVLTNVQIGQKTINTQFKEKREDIEFNSVDFMYKQEVAMYGEVFCNILCTALPENYIPIDIDSMKLISVYPHFPKNKIKMIDTVFTIVKGKEEAMTLIIGKERSNVPTECYYGYLDGLVLYSENDETKIMSAMYFISLLDEFLFYRMSFEL